MDANLLKLLEELFVLEGDISFQNAKKVLTSDNATEAQKNEGRKTVFETVSTIFSRDERIKNYVDAETKDIIDTNGKTIIKDGDYSDEQYICGVIVSMYVEAANAIYDSYLTEALSALEELATKLHSHTSKQILENIDTESDLDKKKYAVKSVLQETIDTINQRAHQNALANYKAGKTTSKKLSENAQKRLETVNDLSRKVTSALETEELIDVHTFKKMLDRLINIEEKMYRMVELGKEDTPLKSATAGSKGSTTTSKGTEIAVYGEAGELAKPFGIKLERKSPKGKTTGPIDDGDKDKDKDPKPKRKIWMWVAGTLVLVTIVATASYFIGKNAGKTVDQPAKPSNSDSPNPSDNPDPLESYIVDNTADPENSQNPTKPGVPGTSTDNPENSQAPGTSTSDPSELTPDIRTEIIQAESTVAQNWNEFGYTISDKQVGEVIKSLHGYESVYTIDEAYEIMMDALNKAVVPAFNNVAAGESNAVKPVDFSSLLIGDPVGLKAAESMEAALNGCIQDPDNIEKYVTDALKDIALLIGEEQTVDGMNVSSNTTTSPSVRLVWATLAQGVKTFAITLDEEPVFQVGDRTYTIDDLNKESTIIDIANAARASLGSASRAMNFQ